MASKHFFKRHQGRGSYDLFSSYNYFLPGLKGMIMLLLMFVVGGLLGNLVILGLTFGLSTEFAQEYGTVISYPLMLGKIIVKEEPSREESKSPEDHKGGAFREQIKPLPSRVVRGFDGQV